jgi:4-hydroxy-tetrahydrodipicolinate reductase
VTLLIELARTAAAALPGFSLAIRETHHRDKRDAPSGTALALAAALAQARPGQQAAEIPVQSLREGEVVGEHAVVLSGAGEELVLGHRALERSIFARGALAAALWLGSKPPGRYSMRDVLAAETAT